MPIAVIEYLRRLAYSHSPSNTAAPAVWNGLDASQPIHFGSVTPLRN